MKREIGAAVGDIVFVALAFSSWWRDDLIGLVFVCFLFFGRLLWRIDDRIRTAADRTDPTGTAAGGEGAE